jgi:hypothetical protein
MRAPVERDQTFIRNAGIEIDRKPIPGTHR